MNWWILIAIVLLVLLICVVIANIFYNLALNRHSRKSRIFDSCDEAEEETRRYRDELDLADDVYIKSFDNLKLHGVLLDKGKRENGWVIGIHGYMEDYRYMYPRVKVLHDNGYSILLPDNRGHGQSEGDYIAMGWDDRLDIIKWIEYLNKTYDNPPILLFGISMGAAAVTITGGEKLPQNVYGIVSDCGYTSAVEEFKFQAKAAYNLPAFPFVYLTSLVTKLRAGYYFSDSSPVEQVRKSSIPFLFIHGETDTLVPPIMAEELYGASSSKDSCKLIVQNAGHARSAKTNPKVYWNTVFKFIDNAKK